MPGHTLKGIVEKLDHYRQRATYGAVAALVGRTPRNVMQGLPRNWRHSWVVAQDNGEPSEYHDLQKHPKLRERELVLATPEELEAWLADPQ